MKALKIIVLAVLLLNINFTLAQNSKEVLRGDVIIHIETGEGNNKKSGEGYFYGFDLLKEKTRYSAIIVDKNLLKNDTD